eukprot:CAMPEP_0183748424 /NCGR_PEP_ID=MMETSP0737-20130205/67763_1 /TAXON_ID=385413 /ORGANISM="Thalassiosira miniscula, Strain CCMP1093" /LENGTH=279 /DNA_ID=CAMNT_0025984147 /DNA_START=223 /DNA_END=1062 /DNA_ORIENTATION=-
MVPTTKTTLINELQNGTQIHIVQVSSFCASSTKAWLFGGIIYLLVILLVSAAIATQNRGIRQEFKEARYLALMIYSHFMFTVLRLIVHIFGELFVQQFAVSATSSLLLSLDTLITIAIYFLPKLYRADKEHFRSQVATTNQRLQHQRSPVDRQDIKEGGDRGSFSCPLQRESEEETNERENWKTRDQDSSTRCLRQEGEHDTTGRKHRKTFTWRLDPSNFPEDMEDSIEEKDRKSAKDEHDAIGRRNRKTFTWPLNPSDFTEDIEDSIEGKVRKSVNTI